MITKGELKEKLLKGSTCYGHWVFMPYSEVISIIGKSGFDFIVIDMEHSFISLDKLPSLLDSATLNNLTPLVRIPTSNSNDILRTLDTGSFGIVVPHCETPEKLNSIVNSSKYYPAGNRGMAKSTKSGEYTNKHFQEYMKSENENLINVVCLESKLSIENIDKLTDVNGIDVFYIGIYDLSASLGLPGEVENPKVLFELENVVKKIRNKGKIVGTYTDTLEQAKKMKNLGINFLTCQADGCLIRDSYENLLKSIKN
tara:strand:- start:1295 stop:2062 length:768 start_codon:yes stop_codon:yes gene_type:complete